MGGPQKMYRASYLLPDPGGKVVRELLDRIDALEKERDAARARAEKLKGLLQLCRDGLRGQSISWITVENVARIDAALAEGE